MNADKLLNAFSELDESQIRSAAALLGLEEEPMKTRKHIKLIRRALLIAAILAVLSFGTAYALGLFTMDVRAPEVGEELVGHSISINPWTREEEQEERDLTQSPLILQFDGEGEIRKVRFRPGWLPDARESDFLERYGDPGVEDWFYYYTSFYNRRLGGPGILYQIECHYAWPGCTVYMDGESARVVREDDWGGLHITEIEQVSNYKAEDGSPVIFRYVLVFDPSAGWFVSVGGTADLETLEHIAREMEFELLDEPAEPNSGDYYYLGVGVG